jgi:hypothetical protein
MEYECLQDVLDEIYYGESNALDWYEPPIIQALKDYGTKDELMKQLAYYFKIWDEGERGVAWQDLEGDFKHFERASWCFYYIFQALPLFKDPSIIPELMQYFPPEGPDQWPWTMEDMWTEIMLQNIASYHYYGKPYIAWLMRSFKYLQKGAEWVVEDLMFSMIFDTFERIRPDIFPDFPVIDALPLADRSMLKKILEQDVIEWRETVEQTRITLHKEDSSEKKELLEEKLFRHQGGLARTEYVLGQLLALPENVVLLHAAD